MRIVIATNWKVEQARTFRHGDVGQETCEETMQLLIMLITREGSRHLHAPVPNSGRKRMHTICLLLKQCMQCACTHKLSWYSCCIVPRTVCNLSIFVPAEIASERRRCKRERFKRQTNLRLWCMIQILEQAIPWHTIVDSSCPGFRTHCNTKHRSYAPTVQYSEGSHLRHDGSAHVRGCHRGTQTMEHLNQTFAHTRLELGTVPRDLDLAVCVPGIA